MSFGKLILFGEHSVVYGKKAIGIPLKNLKVKVDLIDEEIEENQYIKYIKYILKEKYNIENNKFIKINSEIPISSGLGSSAAISIAIAREYKKEYDNVNIKDVANLSEKKIHGNPSGVDVQIILNSKPIIYDKLNGVKNFDFNLGAYLVIFNTGIKGNTLEAVEIVKKDIDKNIEFINNLGEIAEEAILSIEKKELYKIGELMKKAQKNLKKMKLSNEYIDKLVEICDKNSLGSKITGAGLGGCVISLTRSLEEALTLKEKLIFEGVKEVWIEVI